MQYNCNVNWSVIVVADDLITRTNFPELISQDLWCSLWV